MQFLHIISLATYLITISTFSIGFRVGKDSSERRIETYLDLSFDRILISIKDIDCTAENNCTIKNETKEEDKYQDTVYTYQEAILTINVYNTMTGKDEYIDINIRLCDLVINVLGLNPNSTFSDDLKSKPLLQIHVYNKELNFISDTRGSSLSIYKNDESEIYYIDSYFTYSLINNNVIEQDTEMRAKICLHDKDVTEYQYYFFLGNQYFQIDWDNFIEDIRTNSGYTFRADVSSINKENDFNFDYDLKLFYSYDGEPMKYYTNKGYSFCDLFLGDFGAHRAGLRLLLTHNYGNGKLDLSILTENQKYLEFEVNYFKFFIYVFIFATLMYLGYLCYKKLNVKTETNNTDRGGLYESINN